MQHTIGICHIVLNHSVSFSLQASLMFILLLRDGMMAQNQDNIFSMLCKLGLRHVHENFKRQKIDGLDTCKRLTDNDLLSLGLSTIGDRVRFRAEVTCMEAATKSSPGNNSQGLL